MFTDLAEALIEGSIKTKARVCKGWFRASESRIQGLYRCGGSAGFS